MKYQTRGFTLVELLVVIGILGILAAVAIPSYRIYTIKAKLAEVTNGVSHVATALTVYHLNKVASGAGNDWPTCGSKADIQTSLGVSLSALGRMSTASVNQATGTISVTVANIDPTVDGTTMTLSPSTAADSSISWRWGVPSLPDIVQKSKSIFSDVKNFVRGSHRSLNHSLIC